MEPDRASARVPFRRSLSGRLLLLTVLFVLIGEVLIYVPSIARYRLVYLQERIEAGHLATLALEAAPDGKLAPALERRLLDHAMVEAVVLRMPDRSMFMLSTDMPPPVDASFDLRTADAFDLVVAAFRVLGDGPDRTIRVLDESRMTPGTVVEVVLGQRDLHRSMLEFSGRILTLSIVLSLLTAGLVYLTLQWLMVGPMRAITENLARFRANPEATTSQIAATRRSDEIGSAQKTIGDMQRDLRRALLQKTRLAALGLAISKVNHDLRSTLASAMLDSDSLARSDDPAVQKFTPRVFAAIDRAVALCTRTLDYVDAAEPELQCTPVPLRRLLEDVGESIVPDGEERLAWINDVPDGVAVTGDQVQLFRVFQNLGRNALQAIRENGEIRFSASLQANQVLIDVADDGPGIPEPVRDKLFQPFAGSARPGGSGLGLAIARETMRRHGGDITLMETGEAGTRFRLNLPLAR